MTIAGGGAGTVAGAVSTDGVFYGLEPALSAVDFISILRRSGLAERRPVDDVARIEAMLRNADLIVTATIAGQRVGVARSLTDFAYCCYCSDLAVDQGFQGRGIGRELLRQTRILSKAGMCLLLSAPKAISFYEAASLPRHDNCFLFSERP